MAGSSANSDTTPPTPTKPLPLWQRTIQVVAILAGVTGLWLDYGMKAFAPDHLPSFLYVMTFGVAWGIDPALWGGGILSKLTGGDKK